MFIGLNWSVLFVFLAIAVVGLWVAYSFLNKSGLYLYCVIASVIAMTSGSALMFSLEIPVAVAIIPVIHFALLTCLNKAGKDEAKNLFLTTLIVMTSLFVATFFLGAYHDAAHKFSHCLTWDFLGLYLAPILSFVVAVLVTFFLTSKIKVKKLKNFLVLGMYIAIAGCIDALVYTLLMCIGNLAFGKILLTLLIEFVLICAISIGLGYFEQYLNREPKKVEEAAKEEPDPAEEETAKEDLAEDDIFIQ